MTETKKTKSTKGFTIVTYALALLCLLVGLLAPIYGTFSGSDIGTATLLMYLPDIFNKAIGNNLLTGDWVKTFNESAYVMFGKSINVFAWTYLIYTVVTVVGLFMLIPICIGKKTKKTSAACAYVIEAIAAVVLSINIIFQLMVYAGGNWNSINVLVAFAGTILILIIQSIYNKGCFGTAKVVLYILSVLVVIFLFDMTIWITALATPYANLAGNMKSVVAFTGIVWGAAKHLGIYGFDHILNANAYGDIISTYSSINATWGGTLCVLMTILATVAIFNLLNDTVLLATGAKYNEKKDCLRCNSFSKIFGLIRYLIVFVAAILVMIILLITNISIGIYLYPFATLALVQVIISIVRVSLIAKCRKKANAPKRNKKKENAFTFEDDDLTGEFEEHIDILDDSGYVKMRRAIPQTEFGAAPFSVTRLEEDEDFDEDDEDFDFDDDEDDEEEFSDVESFAENQTPAPVKSQPAEEQPTKNVVYKVNTIYDGPLDEFIKTLEDEQKIEFAKTFIEKSTDADLKYLPDYQIGGDNTNFFRSLFIHLGTYRRILSDKLIHKIYQYINSKKKSD
jgi:hypothetical protein